MSPARCAALVWVVLLTAVSGRVMLSSPYSQSVVPIYRNAAERWIAGEDLYAPAPPLDVYRNPPGFAAAFVPFALMPETAAAVLWRLFSAAVFITGLRSLTRHVLPIPPDRVGLLHFVAVVLSIPSVNNGQVNVLLIGLLMHGVTAAVRGRAWTSALFLAGATGLKLYPAAAAMLVIAAVPRIGVRFAVAVVAIFALPLLMASPAYVFEQYAELANHLGADDRTQTSEVARAPHDWTMVPRIGGGIAIDSTTAILLSAVAGMTMFGMIWKLKTTKDPRTVAGLAFGLGSVWMTLFGPATEVPTYTLLAPAAAYGIAVRRRPLAWVAAGLLAVPILRGMFPNGDVLAFRWTLATGAALLTVVLVREALRAMPAVGANVFSGRIGDRQTASTDLRVRPAKRATSSP